MKNILKGKKVAFLATDGFEQVELTKPWDEIKAAGAEVELISLEAGEIQGFNHTDAADKFAVDKTVNNAAVGDYDALILPGGVHNPDALRTSSEAVNFVKKFVESGKPVSAICHGPWLLVEANVVRDREITSWPSLKTDITNAGGSWVDQEVVTDSGITTSRNPDDLEAFCKKTIEEICEGRHDRQVA